MVNLPAGDLVKVVSMVLPSTSLFAVHAQLVAVEIVRLRDEAQLSKWVAQEIADQIYQGGMRSSHVGDFELTAPIRLLANEINDSSPGVFADIQVDPVQVDVLFAEIAAHIVRR